MQQYNSTANLGAPQNSLVYSSVPLSEKVIQATNDSQHFSANSKFAPQISIG